MGETTLLVLSRVEVAEVKLGILQNDGGFVMMGAATDDWAGGSFILGDVNGDGLADIVVGEHFVGRNLLAIPDRVDGHVQ